MNSNSINLTPIGYLHCKRAYHQEQPMQATLSEADGYVELIKGFNYEQGLKDLEGFDYVWLIYIFHHNNNWKPLTNPPFSDGRGRKGVFATRSPYRPNPIGLSCVKINHISGNRLYIEASDILNDTPILDIKPYIREYDSFPEARRGWLDNIVKEKYEIIFSAQATRQLTFLAERKLDLAGVINTQLAYNPFDKTRNKFVKTETGGLLRFRSWRIEFSLIDTQVLIERISSGYQDFNELLGDDSSIDLEVHRNFCSVFQKDK